MAAPPRPPPQPPPGTERGPTICVLQGEIAFAPAAESATLASVDATTCVIAALATRAGVSVAHVDGATAPDVAAALWGGHEGGGGGGKGDVFLVGGFDDRSPGAPGPAVAAAVLASLAGFGPATFTLRLAVLAAANRGGDTARGGAPRPAATSLALTVGSSHPPFQCELNDRGPSVPARVARLWEALPPHPVNGGGGDATPFPRGLARVYAGGGVFHVAPLTGECGPSSKHDDEDVPPAATPPRGGWPSRRAAVAWLAAQPDAALLAAASTSPAVEPPRFVTDTRAALELLLSGARGGGRRFVWRGGAWVAQTDSIFD